MTYPLTAIISDLHGNIPALDTALEDARDRKVERFVCLGDVVGYGAQPRECLELVMELTDEEPRDRGARTQAPDLQGGLCLQGNHEYALLNSAEDFNPKARAAIEWTREQLNDSADRERNYLFWEYLDRLSSARTDDVAMFAHGSPRDPVREYLLPRDIQDHEKMAANFECMQREVCFVGHSHVPAVYYEDGRLFLPKGTEGPYDLGVSQTKRAIVNVGSVGQPRDGDSRLSYVIFNGQQLTFIRLEYSHEQAAARIRAVPELPDFLADRLAVGR